MKIRRFLIAAIVAIVLVTAGHGQEKLPPDGKLVKSLPAPPGHWNSPIVAGGRAYLPSGDANNHDTTGALTIYGPG